MQISSRFTIALHIFTCADVFQDQYKVTSDFLAGSINTNPVIIRKILAQLKKAGLIKVASAGDNSFAIEAEDVNGEFSIMLNEYMVDFSQPVTFVVNGEETTLTLTPDMTILTATTEDRGDPWYQFEAMVTFTAQ